MDAFTQAFLVFSGMIACLAVGYHLGFDLGKKQVMTRTQAARIMAKASWDKRPQYAGSVRSSFFRTVNK